MWKPSLETFAWMQCKIFLACQIQTGETQGMCSWPERDTVFKRALPLSGNTNRDVQKRLRSFLMEVFLVQRFWWKNNLIKIKWTKFPYQWVTGMSGKPKVHKLWQKRNYGVWDGNMSKTVTAVFLFVITQGIFSRAKSKKNFVCWLAICKVSYWTKCDYVEILILNMTNPIAWKI